jgi:hypothetical protein
MANTKISLMIPDEIKNYFDEQVTTLGIARNGIIVMALKQYIDQQKVIKEMSGVQVLFDKLGDMKKALNL